MRALRRLISWILGRRLNQLICQYLILVLTSLNTTTYSYNKNKMKTTEFMDLLHELGVAKVLIFFMAIGLFSTAIALTIVFFHVSR